jgi:hypothetical protein
MAVDVLQCNQYIYKRLLRPEDWVIFRIINEHSKVCPRPLFAILSYSPIEFLPLAAW